VITLLSDVADFHRAMGQPIATTPQLLPTERIELRARLISEEYNETIAALRADDLVGVADGLADLIYVAVGCALEMGIPLDKVWAEVQRSNMAKVGGEKRADGKIMKPPGWVAPDIAGAMGLSR
jgi:predicted HAD superfamily Cof-like phosphohydrolase